MSTYSLNKNIVIREDDSIIFDSNKFIIHKFNSCGFSIIKHYFNGPLDTEQLFKIFPDITNEDLELFIKKACEAGILMICEYDSPTKNRF